MMKTTTTTARALWIAINLVCITATTGSTATQPAQPTRATVVAEAQRPRAAERAEATKEADSEESAPRKTQLRRVRGREMNVRLAEKAAEIIREHHKKPFGTDIPFEMDGKSYVGRIERHYHPPGGELRPWGEHPGCSLFIAESEG